MTTPAPLPSELLPSGQLRLEISNVNASLSPEQQAIRNGIANFRVFNPYRATHNNKPIIIDTSGLLLQASERYEQYASALRNNGPRTVTTTTPNPFSVLGIPSPSVNITTTQPPM